MTANRAFASVYSCAQYTAVVSGRAMIFWIERHMVAASPSNRRPHPIANRVSPTNTFASPAKWYATCPAVCPGTSRTFASMEPSFTTSS